MPFTTKATYENGLLRLGQPLPLNEHERVLVTIEPEQGWTDGTAGMIQWTGDFDDLRRLAEGDDFGVREAR